MKYEFYTNASKNNQLLYDVISENLFEIEFIRSESIIATF